MDDAGLKASLGLGQGKGFEVLLMPAGCLSVQQQRGCAGKQTKPCGGAFYELLYKLIENQLK
eukprot:3070783-Rhodomonas_salina.4